MLKRTLLFTNPVYLSMFGNNHSHKLKLCELWFDVEKQYMATKGSNGSISVCCGLM